MNRIRCRSGLTGLTLIELLCVIAIITVLAALLLGAANRVLQKVRADQWTEQAEEHLWQIAEKLQTEYQGKRTFPLVTLADLESHGTLNPAQIRFLEDSRVTFTPFAATDDDEKVVISVQLDKGFWGAAGFRTATKGEITKSPH
jgi:prepilin-type N-terminal cleavage/methylation domain-containing protein